MATVTIRTSDGKVYTDPSEVHIPRNKKNEAFYSMVDQHVPKTQSDTEDKTAQAVGRRTSRVQTSDKKDEKKIKAMATAEKEEAAV